jgi:isoquinoline 1-oxidoreductase beta subunit
VLIDETAEGGPRAQVWAPTQVPDLARRAVARVLGLAEERVALHVTWLGGGFGRRLEVDFVAQAADIAREAARRGLGRGGRTAVHTLWSRQEDATHDFLRPAAVARMAAGLDAQGRLVAWRHLVASQAVLPQVLQRLWGLPFAGPDKTALEGAFDQPYEFAAARAAHRPVELPVPVGFWRSVGHSHNAFFKDAVLDEVAHAAGADPLAFRLALLQRHPRHAAVLRRVAERAGWGTPLPPAPDGAPRARGLALHESFGSVVAQVVEASVGPAGSATPAVRVHRVVCTIDCGTVVNPDGVRQQMEGAVVFALSAALHGGVRLQAGRIQGRQLDDPPLLRLAQCPDIEVELMASDAPPQGVGEPGVPPLAPALANALFALTGVRQRSLPLRAAS